MPSDPTLQRTPCENGGGNGKTGQRGKGRRFSWLAIALGALSLACAAGGGRLAKVVSPGEPPSLLEHAEGRPLTREDLKDAAKDAAGDLADKAGDLAGRGYRHSKNWLKRKLELDDANGGAENGGSQAIRDESTSAATANRERQGAAGAVSQDSSAVGEGEKSGRPRLRDRFRVNLSSFTDAQKSWLRTFYDIGLFGGLAALLVGLVGWIRREDGRAALVGVGLGVLSMLWAQMIMALSWLVFSEW